MPKGIYKRKGKGLRKVRSKSTQPGVATASTIIHESNFIEEQEVEVYVGSDKILRVNIDGICAIRVRCPDEGITIHLRNNQAHKVHAFVTS